ncbi:phospho-sugar mutase [Olsenella uli]|uniref:phospho-sugar mutase n=1 Tax=Olsenella uli TaxID=133926 RepID=UPI0012AB53D6|nr:phospho-sugar mutase [Olsenella uli]
MDDTIREAAQLWKENVTEPDLASELDQLMADPDSEKLSDAFYRSLAFGTAGLRGTLGVGTNRMNVYTVAQASQGLATYLNAHFENPTVAIARDSRNKGEDFVKAAAGVLAANGIKSFVYPRIEPVPTLSYATRDLKCSAGICVTASHNPAQYNGYKVYGPDGCQIANEAADEIQNTINETDIFHGVKQMDFDEALEKGLVEWTPDAVLDRFIDAVASQSIGTKPNPDFSVVYTPLNGTGMECMHRILERVGITNVTVVPEQANPDGNFPTCPYPNPEFREALEKGLELCDKVHPDLMLATDPDADRMGVAVPHDGDYKLLTGNEMGILLIDWLTRMKAEAGEDITRKVAVPTIVSTAMPDAIARAKGFEVRRVLTGFKNIGGQMDQLVEAGQGDRFLLGFEESYGYLVGLHARDKDAIVASMLTCEMAAWYAERGKDLFEAMEALYQEYGYYLNGVVNVSFPGEAGAGKMAGIMSGLRENPPVQIAGLPVEGVVDYKTDVEMPVVGGDGNTPAQLLPKSNVLEYRLGEGVKVIVRPSGTEPKIKAYLFSKGATREESQALNDRLAEAAKTELLA